ncbi:shikimate dehydrogenase [Roseomonas sp. JC162]|uniref:Shikimate dehydrogenase (NADP(+)) n=1 Tax=Neoroseomonas marina TaxID=1232220 RepID=A0A848EJ05_9PROT|nr:shikimate dehydrogenase [Neoroseomonas marina]NMJ43373.1 shikimate dehydrogenase [Neoroseomonas marina]
MRWDEQPAVLEGLIGSHIQASLTPAMHEREGAEQGLRLIYRRIDIDVLGLGPEALPDLLAAAEWTGFAGVNITFPCKQSVIPLLHDLTDEARALGAVNTVVLRDGRRIGHNTDCSGFAEAFRRSLPDVARRHVVMIGAGGAGAAVAHALLAEGVERLSVHDAEASRAEALVRGLLARFGANRARAIEAVAQAMGDADGLVNCTPVGMTKLPGMPLPAALLRPELWVADVIYFPIETALLRAARAAGCRTLDGGGMAVFQAVGAFRLFTGIAPDPERMLRHFTAMVQAGR